MMKLIVNGTDTGILVKDLQDAIYGNASSALLLQGKQIVRTEYNAQNNSLLVYIVPEIQ